MSENLYDAPGYNPNHDLKWLENSSVPQSIQFMIDLLPTIRKCIKNWPKEKTLHVLDVGTSTGSGANLLATLHRTSMPVKMKIDAIDLIDSYKKYANHYFKDINYLVGDIFELNKEKKWDMVICSHLIEHFKNPMEFINELQRRSRFWTIFYTPYNEKKLIRSHVISYDDKYIKKLKPTSYEIIESPAWVHPDDKESKCIILTYSNPNMSNLLKIQKIRTIIEETKYDKAFNEISQLLKKSPSHGELNYLAGFCLQKLNTTLEIALEHYETALKNNFDEFWTRLNRGFLYISLGNKEMAEKDLYAALKISPSNKIVQNAINLLKSIV